MVAEVLEFDNHSRDTMQRMLENIEFFKVESAGGDYEVNQFDFNKIILFCLLFSNEKPRDKIDCLFYLICDDNHEVASNSDKVKTIIAMLTIISCMIPSELIKIVSFYFISSCMFCLLLPFIVAHVLGQIA